MGRNDEGSQERAQTLRAGHASPTPLFLGFLGALGLSAAVSFSGGVTLTAAVDFLVLAAVVALSVLTAFGVAMVWSVRAGQRAAVLSQVRPDAVVVPAQRAPGIARGAHALGVDLPVMPLGLTLVADDSGLEVWSGSPENLLRVGRAPWHRVAGIRATRVTRMGRSGGGIVVTVTDGSDDNVVELPFAIVGAGLGGLFAPGGARLDAIVASLEARRVDALEYA